MQASTLARIIMDSSLTAAILVVSTTAASDPKADASTPILSQVLDEEGAGKWSVEDTQIVPDVVTRIQQQILKWTDGENPFNLIITTGGTGFAESDGTPEVRIF